MVTVRSPLHVGVHDADGSMPDPTYNQACHKIQAIEVFSFLGFFLCVSSRSEEFIMHGKGCAVFHI